jgi:hypothetical protein
MKKLKISIIDLICNNSNQTLSNRSMSSNYMSIMPQVIGVWCKEEGHEIHYSIYTGSRSLNNLLRDKPDLVFISSFTFTAQIAYSISNYFRSKGVTTVLGGPHARCYPEDACKYFDYALGLTDKELLKDILHNFERSRPEGRYLSASVQPKSIPGVRERWEFIEMAQTQFSIIKVVPMIGGFGCPFKCDYCIDSGIPYHMLDLEVIKEDLRFLVKKMKHPRVAWWDPNFGVNFNVFMDSIESAVPPGSIEFGAQSSLATLTETNVKRLNRNGFKVIMAGIESWFDYGNKSKTGSISGIEKVYNVAEQVNMIQRYIPLIQTNFIFGFDSDEGAEPFELTKRFIELAPGAYPAFSLLSIYGQGINSNLRFIVEDRLIPYPFHFLDIASTLNITLKNYKWEAFFNHFIDLLKYNFSYKVLYDRFKALDVTVPMLIMLFMSLSEGRGRAEDLSYMVKNLRRYQDFDSFVKKESAIVPAFMIEKVKKDLGPLWDWLPNKSLTYDVTTVPKIM